MSAGQYGVTSSFGGSTGVGPFLVPSGLTSGAAIAVYVVGPVSPGAPAGAVTLPNVTLPAPAPATQSTFSLNIVPAGGYPLSAVQVGVDKTVAWSADPTQRATMATAFKVFRAQLEALEAATDHLDELLVEATGDDAIEAPQAAASRSGDREETPAPDVATTPAPVDPTAPIDPASVFEQTPAPAPVPLVPPTTGK